MGALKDIKEVLDVWDGELPRWEPHMNIYREELKAENELILRALAELLEEKEDRARENERRGEMRRWGA